MSQAFWIPDNRNALLRYVDASGVISTPVITCTDPVYVDNGGFSGVWQLAADSNGHIFIADFSAKCVYMLDTATLVMVRVAGRGNPIHSGAGALSWVLKTPYIIATDSKGNLYIGDINDLAIVAVNMQLTTQTILGVSIAAGAAAYVVSGLAGIGFAGDGLLASDPAVKINAPYGIAFDSQDNLFFADQNNFRIRRVDAITGIITTVVGSGLVFPTLNTGNGGYSGDGGAPLSAEINSPLGVCFDAADNLYIMDTYNNVIRVWNRQGTTQTLLGKVVAAGTIETIPGYVSSHALWFGAFNTSGNLLFCDVLTGYAKITEITSAGAVTVAAGNGTPGNTGDGGPATSALIGEAFGLAMVPEATGSIRIVKATVPGGAAQPFTFNPSWGSPFVLHDGQSNDSGPLAPGTYSITEDAVANWGTLVSGGDPTNIVVTPGSSITLVFTNTFVPPAPGRIIVHKVTDPVADPQVFTFRPSWGAPFVLGDGQSNDSGPLAAGTYAVTEDPVDGWTTETSQDPSTIVVEDGSNTDITFTNTKTPICIVQPPETGVMKFARGIGDLNNEMLALECSNEAVAGAWFELHEMVLYARPSAQSRKG